MKSPDSPTAADGDGGLASELLGPAGEVQVARPRIPAPRSGAASSGRYRRRRSTAAPEAPQFLRGCRQPRRVVLLLPLREAQDDREIRPGRVARHGLDDLGCEAGAADQVAAIFVGALIGARPEELVDQVAMGAVDLDAVESQALRVRGGLTEGLDNAADMLARHRLRMLEAGLGQAREAGHGQARRAGARQLRMGRLGRVARHTDMPELRHDLAAGLMHRVDDTQPAIERRTAEVRDVDAHGRDGVVDHRAFGDDQARPTFGAPPVVGRDLRAGNAASRSSAGSSAPSRRGWRGGACSRRTCGRAGRRLSPHQGPPTLRQRRRPASESGFDIESLPTDATRCGAAFERPRSRANG